MSSNSGSIPKNGTTTRAELQIDTNNDVAFKSVVLNKNIKVSHDKINGLVETDLQAPSDLHFKTGDNKTLVYDTAIWDDMRTTINNARAIPGKEASFIAYRGGIVLEFDSGRDEGVSFIVQLPHSYKIGSDLEFHIHNAIQTEGAGNIKWNFTYAWASIDEDIPIETTISTIIDASAKVANHHYLDEIAPVINGAGKNISSILICSLTRDVSVTNNFASSVYLVEVDFHFQSDTNGSRYEGAK